jgi:ATP-dependent Clp protease adaptor protein ClpS
MASDTIIEKDTKTISKNKEKSQEPTRYKVIVCNDDVTPVEFVISMLVAVFRHSEKSSLELTLKIHNNGHAVVGIYSYEVADQKGIDATNLARTNGFPLIIKVEPE